MTVSKPCRQSGVFERFTLAVAGLSVAVGVIVLLGWLFDLDLLKSFFPGAAPMKANAALSFMLSGVSLWGTRASGQCLRVASRVCAGAVLLLGLLTLGENLSSANFSIDQLLFRETANPLYGIPGRMAVSTALGFVALGAALLLLNLQKTGFGIAIHALAMVSLVAAGSTIIGYIFDIEAFFWMSRRYGPMAVNTSVVLVLLSLGCVVARADYPLRRFITSGSAAGVIVRRLLPGVIGFTVVTGGFVDLSYDEGYFSETVGLALFTAACIVWQSVLIFWCAGVLYQADAKREQAEDELRNYQERLKELVRERTEKLEMANKDLEGFAYSVSHDLRVPLRAIDGFSQLVLKRYEDKLDDEGKRFLNVVRDNTKKMGKLIDDILAFSRMGRLEMAVAEVDMDTLAHEVFDELKPAAAGRELLAEIARLPSASGDRSMLRQVWVNLLGNALKFSQPKAAARIEVGGSTEGPEHIYYVRDNGAGFDMRYADKLFGVFQRLHGVDEFEGTGIGLAIVKRIVTRHGGRVWAEGRVDEGATFYFTLPGREINT